MGLLLVVFVLAFCLQLVLDEQSAQRDLNGRKLLYLLQFERFHLLMLPSEHLQQAVSVRAKARSSKLMLAKTHGFKENRRKKTKETKRRKTEEAEVSAQPIL